MKSFAPPAALAPFVRDFMIVDVDDEVTRVRVPEPGLVLGVRYRGFASLLGENTEVRLPNVTLTGMSHTARRMRTGARGGVVLARFHPGGAAQFFDQPLDELFGSTASLAEILPTAARELGDRVTEATSPASRLEALECFLLGRLRPRIPDPVVVRALSEITSVGGAVKIGPLARSLGISQDPLEKRFRRAVGATPKQFASLLRLRRAIDGYRPGASLADLALESGFFDQSHFSRELRAMTGQSPHRFFRAGEYR